MDEYYSEYDKVYCYGDTGVLKNKLGIIDANQLMTAEREITALRMAEGMINRVEGNFDFNHLKAIHYFLFRDIYEWAGQTRTINISKGSEFCRVEYIEEQAKLLFNKLKKEDYLRKYTDINQVAERLAYYISEINAIHPFREGNGRAQRMFIEYLSYYNGYQLDFMKITSEEMLEASIQSFNIDYTMMEQLFKRAISSLK